MALKYFFFVLQKDVHWFKSQIYRVPQQKYLIFHSQGWIYQLLISFYRKPPGGLWGFPDNWRHCWSTQYPLIFGQNLKHQAIKTNNLQNNTLVRWANGTNDSSTKRLMFQVFSLFFFIISYRLRTLKALYFHFHNFM